MREKYRVGVDFSPMHGEKKPEGGNAQPGKNKSSRKRKVNDINSKDHLRWTSYPSKK